MRYPHIRRLGNAICREVSLGNDLDVRRKYAIRWNQETTKSNPASVPVSLNLPKSTLASAV